jgi:hypothetical protein
MREERPGLEAGLVFAAFFVLGLVQAAPTITPGDAGELAACAATLGVPHAPGYPLFVLAARAFGTLLPFGDWAHRLDLFSAFCAAAALALLADALRRFGAGRAARLGAAAVLGLSPLWRRQAAVTEVFALHLLGALLLLWLAAWAGERALDDGPAAGLGLVFGLWLGDHQTLVLILPAVVLAARARPARLPRALLFAALGTLAGLGIYAEAPLRSAKLPPLDWDHAASLSGFWRLLTRKDYGSLSLTVDGGASSGLPGLAAQAWRSLKTVGGQLGPVGTALALLGAASWRRSSLRLPASAAWVWLLAAGPLFLMIGRPPFDPQTSDALARFALLPLAGAALFAAAGLETLSRLRPAAGVAGALAAALALAPAAAAEGRRGDYLAWDYGRTLLRELPPDAALAMDGGDDTFYALAYLTEARGLRPDLRLFDRGGVVFRSPYGADFRGLAKDAKAARRREVEGRLADSGRLWYSTLNAGLLPGRELRPAGLLRRALRPGAAFPEAAALDEGVVSPRAPGAARRYRERALAAFFDFSRGADALARGDAAAGTARLTLAAARAPDALWALPAVSYALSVTGYAAVGRRDWPAAESAYRALAFVRPGDAGPRTDLAVVLEKSGRLKDAEAGYRAAIAADPRAPRPWASLGALYWREGRRQDCADAYASAAALAPGDAALAGWAAKARARAR